MGRPRTWTDDDLREAVASSTSLAEVVRPLRLHRGGAAYVTVRTRMEVLGLQLASTRQPTSAGGATSSDSSPSSTGSLEPSIRTWTEDELREAVREGRSLNQVFQLLGLTVGGSQWLVIRSLILERGWSTEHWKRPLQGSAARETSGSKPFRTRLEAVNADVMVRESRSRAELIRSLGFSPNTTTYRVLNDYIRRNGLDIGHFEASHDAMRRTPRRRYRTSLDDILVKDSTYTSIRTLKERLIDAGLIEPVCAECGIDSWNGRPIVLHLDHINGIRDDHRLENLRFLCPNCHSQTDTYCGRNQGRYVSRSVA